MFVRPGLKSLPVRSSQSVWGPALFFKNEPEIEQEPKMRPKSGRSSNGPPTCSKRLKTSPEHAVALQKVDGTQPEACQSGALSQFEFPHLSSDESCTFGSYAWPKYFIRYEFIFSIHWSERNAERVSFRYILYFFLVVNDLTNFVGFAIYFFFIVMKRHNRFFWIGDFCFIPFVIALPDKAFFVMLRESVLN